MATIKDSHFSMLRPSFGAAALLYYVLLQFFSNSIVMRNIFYARNKTKLFSFS